MTDQTAFTPAFCIPLSEPVDGNVRGLGVFVRGDNELSVEEWSPIHNQHTGKPYVMALATSQVNRAKLGKLLNVPESASLDALHHAMVTDGKQQPGTLIGHIRACAIETWDNEIYSDLPFAEWPESAEIAFNVKLAA